MLLVTSYGALGWKVVLGTRAGLKTFRLASGPKSWLQVYLHEPSKWECMLVLATPPASISSKYKGPAEVMVCKKQGPFLVLQYVAKRAFQGITLPMLKKLVDECGMSFP